MLENFIYAKRKSLFEEKLNNGEVLDESIAFIEDTKEIWNHGTYFATQLSIDEIENIVSSSETVQSVMEQVVLDTLDSLPVSIVSDGDGSKFLSDDGSYKIVESKFIKFSSNNQLKFYCIEPVTITLNGEDTIYPANSSVSVTLMDSDEWTITPTSDNSITLLESWPGTLGTFYSWLEGVQVFSSIVFDMNDLAMYEKWNQGHQGEYHVQFAQYNDCIFWSDNSYVNAVAERTNYTLYYSSQLPLCYSSVPENTFKAFYMAYNVTSDPNWSNPLYKESFAQATWATQVFSYYGLHSIGMFDMDSPDFNITLPKDCRGLMFYAPNVLNAGVFDATNVTNFGAMSGSWRDAFAYCYCLENLNIKNLKVNLNVSWSPISQVSLNFILSNAANTSAITIYLSPVTYYALTDDNKNIAAEKNITLSLIDTNWDEDKRTKAIQLVGDGSKFLSDDGTYKEISNAVIVNLTDSSITEEKYNEICEAIVNGIPINVIIYNEVVNNFVGIKQADATMDPGGNIYLYFTVANNDAHIRFCESIINSNDYSVTVSLTPINDLKDVYVFSLGNVTSSEDFTNLKAAIDSNKVIIIGTLPFVHASGRWSKNAIVLENSTSKIILRTHFEQTTYLITNGKTDRNIDEFVDITINSDGTYSHEYKGFTIKQTGSGSAFLSDDGTYKEVSIPTKVSDLEDGPSIVESIEESKEVFIVTSDMITQVIDPGIAATITFTDESWSGFIEAVEVNKIIALDHKVTAMLMNYAIPMFTEVSSGYFILTGLHYYSEIGLVNGYISFLGTEFTPAIYQIDFDNKVVTSTVVNTPSEVYHLSTSTYSTAEDFNNLKAAIEANKVIIVDGHIVSSNILSNGNCLCEYSYNIPDFSGGSPYPMTSNFVEVKFNTDGTYTVNRYGGPSLYTDNDGTKFLADDGEYKTIDLATTTTSGLMSAEDKTKLDQITSSNTSIVTQAEYDALVAAGATTSGSIYYIRG